MSRLFYTIILIFVAQSCNNDSADNECIDPQNIDLNQVCIEIYQPVCGCDQKTYSNSCYASINGLSDWTEGACE